MWNCSSAVLFWRPPRGRWRHDDLWYEVSFKKREGSLLSSQDPHIPLSQTALILPPHDISLLYFNIIVAPASALLSALHILPLKRPPTMHATCPFTWFRRCYSVAQSVVTFLTHGMWLLLVPSFACSDTILHSRGVAGGVGVGVCGSPRVDRINILNKKKWFLVLKKFWTVEVTWEECQ
jgi:hypothetical protein